MLMIGIYFIYGLAFFLLGFSILLYPKKRTSLKIANNLWLIAAFGIVHGMSEWIDMFSFIPSLFEVNYLKVIRLFLLPVSFTFLVLFGVTTLVETLKKYVFLKTLPVLLPIGWAIITATSNDHFLIGGIMARYLLGIPGTILTSLALIALLPELEKTKSTVLIGSQKLAAGAFFSYGLFSGLIVRNADFFPASYLNYSLFKDISGVPVEVARTLCAAIASYSIIRVLAVFGWEADKALSDSEERYRTLAETAVDAIFVIDREVKLEYVNEYGARLLGHHPEDIIGRPCETLFPEAFNAHEVKLREVLENGIHSYAEMKLPFPKDNRWFSTQFVPLRNESGDVTAAMGISRDITERKRVEDRLTLLKEAVEALPIGITIVDTAEKIIYINPAEAEMHGYRMEELIGKDARILAPREAWNPIVFEQLHAMGIYKRESTNIRPNGERFPVQLTSIAVRNTLGAPIGIITACEDITERKRMEERLIHRQEVLEAVYKMATTAGRSFKSVCDDVVINLSRLLRVSHIMILRRQDGMIKVISAIADGILQPVRAGCPEKDCPCVSVYAGKRVCQIEGSLRDICSDHLFAEYDLMNMLCVPILDSSNNAAGAIDISDRMKLKFTEDEIHLIEVFARYIAFVSDSDAMEEKLREAQKMEVIGKLAGGVAHEVRNPLNAIMAISEALFLDLGEEPEYKPLLDNIRVQVDRLSGLMSDLLDLGKPVEQVYKSRESLVEICSASIDIWKHSGLIRSHKVRLVHPQSNGTLSVFADARRLQQAFINILDNAAQHSPEGSEIQIVICECEVRVCRTQVIDRGSGIPPEILSRIFEPFFSTRQGGTGLGMSIVKHIVEAHGGTITIMNNDPPPGCTVEIRLPIDDEDR
jgi:PAS domain S-box-containing protein